MLSDDVALYDCMPLVCPAIVMMACLASAVTRWTDHTQELGNACCQSLTQ